MSLLKMKLLIVGGAGYVGSIVVPALEKEFACTHFDMTPVKSYEDHSVLEDVGDDAKVQQAVIGMDAVLYLAMGTGKHRGPNGRPNVHEINPMFDVNVRGLYRFLHMSLEAGAKRFIYASSLSVYNNIRDGTVFDESRPANAWNTYGLSNRVNDVLGWLPRNE